MYPSLISTKCKKILNEASKYNIWNHPDASALVNQIQELTAHFPTAISFSQRLSAIAAQSACVCEVCGHVHGRVDKQYCSSKCYGAARRAAAPTKEDAEHAKRVKKAEAKFARKVEGRDYLTCAICGVKSGDLGSHVHMHSITPAEYKQKYNLQSLKPDANRDNRRGENNPAFNHGGKYSKWSKNFVHGYDEQSHAEKNRRQSEFVKSNPHLFKNNYEYWLAQTDGDIELATQLHKQHQIRDLSYFVNKYGKEEGTRRHALKTQRWMKSHKSSNFSKISQELFDLLIKHIPTDSVYYATFERADQAARKNKEYILHVGNTYIRPDFVCLDKKRIVEFDGDYWHSEAVANPAREAERDRLIKEAGYDVLHVKERDYKANKEKVLQECINFLTQ